MFRDVGAVKNARAAEVIVFDHERYIVNDDMRAARHDAFVAGHVALVGKNDGRRHLKDAIVGAHDAIVPFHDAIVTAHDAIVRFTMRSFVRTMRSFRFTMRS